LLLVARALRPWSVREIIFSAEIVFFPMDAVQIKHVDAHAKVIYDARCSPDTTMFATAAMDHAVKIWNMNATPTY
jgi:hypothetical protein